MNSWRASSIGNVLAFWVLALAFGSVALRGDEVEFKLLPSGATRKLGGYIPQRLTLTSEKTAAFKKLPANLSAPLFGVLKIGPAESPTSIAVIVDEPEGKPGRLWVDANANGDLTDDPPARWTPRESKTKDGVPLTQYLGGAEVSVAYPNGTVALTLQMYRFDKNDPGRAAFKGILFYYGDYGREGELTLGGKKFAAILADRMTTGDFRGKGGANDTELLIDLNGDGKFDSRSERFSVREPFNIGGVTYEISGLNAGGDKFKVDRSTRTVAERKAPPALISGKKALGFRARTTTGMDVNFPASYKGKLVILDFWATWCGPCVAELPHLTAAYGKYHPRGLEVLGISLDQERAEQKLASFTRERNMPWPQVYDGKYWKAAVAVLYNIESIPSAFLVDGDTGEIVASGTQLRGENLDKTLERAMAKKK